MKKQLEKQLVEEGEGSIEKLRIKVGSEGGGSLHTSNTWAVVSDSGKKTKT